MSCGVLGGLKESKSGGGERWGGGEEGKGPFDKNFAKVQKKEKEKKEKKSNEEALWLRHERLISM